MVTRRWTWKVHCVIRTWGSDTKAGGEGEALYLGYGT